MCLLVVITVIVVLLVRRRHRRQRPIDKKVVPEGVSMASSSAERDDNDYFGDDTLPNARKTLPPSPRLGASAKHEHGDTALKNTVKKPTSEYGAVSTVVEVWQCFKFFNFFVTTSLINLSFFFFLKGTELIRAGKTTLWIQILSNC